MKRRPTFSILHTSARPDKWRAVYDDWMSKAAYPKEVEYVLCIDPRWGFPLDPENYELPNLVVVQNTGRKCYVDGVNLAARGSTGAILVVNADDQFACEQWDNELIKAVVDFRDAEGSQRWEGSSIIESAATADPFVVEVSTGTTEEHERGILVMPVLSRVRYERLGYVFFPEYESMYADNDFCQHARYDEIVIDARHLFFEHRHWLMNKREGDAADLFQNRKQAHELGKRILKKRQAAHFQQCSTRRSIAFCYPGDDFRGRMVDSLMEIYSHLIELDFEVLKVRTHSTIVYQTREDIRRTVMSMNPRTELTLWLDHDNPLSAAQFDQLLKDLDENPDADGVCGWAWIFDRNKQSFMVSCGEWAPDRLHWNPFPATFSREQKLRPIECGGFPCFLMRTSTFDKAGDSPFLPVLDNRLEHGMLGEDFAFFLRAEDGNCKFLVDPKVRVPHLKYVDVTPVLPEDGAAPPVKVACMMRVKNEGRWIKRVIESVKPLCGANIFVMEDGSSDDTVLQCWEAGAKVLTSPFIGQGLDERRDKNWLLAEVNRQVLATDGQAPEWILMPDGDEELAPGACDKLKLILEGNPAVDVFALRIINLWNSIDTIRLDGAYGGMCRESLFRSNIGLEFKSFYEGEGENHNHVGLHCSNAPGMIDATVRKAPLQVPLLHYGYLHQEDRIRKYRWILSIDPNNEKEDFYVHTVLGDLFPADRKCKHGGPLELRKLPAHLIPRFDGEVPGPRDSGSAVTPREPVMGD